MLKNLQEAHEAFIFGAPFAALGLMRSIMEVMLRDHYEIPGKDSNQRINNAGMDLPPGASAAALHRLRKLANTVLHLKDKDEGLPNVEHARLEKKRAGLEKEIVSLLYVLRALIEGAPQWRSKGSDSSPGD